MKIPRFAAATEEWSAKRLDLLAVFVVLAGFVVRFWSAAVTFVNPDEAYHVLLAYPDNFSDLLTSAVRSPHPPLFIVLLHFIRKLTMSDLGIRIIPLVCGSLFPWVMYRWMGREWGKHAGLAALAMLTLGPELIYLSAQARAYTMALLFMSVALYLLDRATEFGSPLRMAGFGLCLYGAILSDYSAAFFTVAAGVYFLLRVREKSVSTDTRIVWELSQVGVVVVYAALWVVQIYPMKQIATSRADVEGWLRDCYPQPEQNPILFVVLNTSRQFAFLLPLLLPAVAAILLFFGGLWLLWRKGAGDGVWRSRATVMLLIIPFVASCAASFAYLFPYGRTRHTVFLALFIAAGVGIALTKVGRAWIVPLALLTTLLIPAWQFTHGKHRGPIGRADGRLEQMEQAIAFLRENVRPDSVILVESEFRVVLAYYLDGGKRQPEPYATPWEERIGGFRLFATRWDYSSIDQLKDDLRLMRGEYGLGPDDRIWVLDGGFLELLDEPLRDMERQGQIEKVHRFGRAMIAFQTPAGFLWEKPGPEDKVEPPVPASLSYR